MLVNMTPHTVNIHNAQGDVITLPPSTQSVRVKADLVKVEEHDGIDIYAVQYGDLEMVDNATKIATPGLPPATDGVLYIVAGMCTDKIRATTDRKDFVSPGDLIRDDKGQPVGCKGVKRI